MSEARPCGDCSPPRKERTGRLHHVAGGRALGSASSASRSPPAHYQLQPAALRGWRVDRLHELSGVERDASLANPEADGVGVPADRLGVLDLIGPLENALDV